jgi:hypothetical protein
MREFSIELQENILKGFCGCKSGLFYTFLWKSGNAIRNIQNSQSVVYPRLNIVVGQ